MEKLSAILDGLTTVQPELATNRDSQSLYMYTVSVFTCTYMYFWLHKEGESLKVYNYIQYTAFAVAWLHKKPINFIIESLDFITRDDAGTP